MTETQIIHSMVAGGVSVLKGKKEKISSKRKTPEWRKVRKIIFQNIHKAQQEKRIAMLYWRKYLTAKEIAEEVFQDSSKTECVKSILYRLRKLSNATSENHS